MEHLSFTEGGLHFEELITEDQKTAAYRLRYEICSLRLKWIPGDPATRLETDKWDAIAHHFGVFNQSGQLIAYMRMVPDSPASTMTRECFPYLIKHRDTPVPMEESADLSRLIVDPAYHGRKTLVAILLGLYRLTYARSVLKGRGIRYWYFVTNKREIQGIRLGLRVPVRVLGGDKTPDGKINYACRMDIKAGMVCMAIFAPRQYRRFRRTIQCLVTTATSTVGPIEAETIDIAA
jgi:N-acyl-L-homoserine lactone synthetase